MSADTTGATLLVSPAEPQRVKDAIARRLDMEVSALPERYGVDFLWRGRGVWHGLQRKTVSDFVASLLDGRVTREVAQMQSHVSMPVLLIEGRVQFSLAGNDGAVLVNSGYGQSITQAQWRGMMWSLASRGITVDVVATIADTADYVCQFMKWSLKATHTSVTARPKLVDSAWGKPTNRDFGVYLLQGFDGVGPGTAGAIFDHFGRVPLRWDVDDGDELTEIKGVGKATAQKLLEALG